MTTACPVELHVATNGISYISNSRPAQGNGTIGHSYL